jgi:hypothetical protein
MSALLHGFVLVIVFVEVIDGSAADWSLSLDLH